MISSPWKITYDPTGTPLVLVDFDDDLEGVIKFPWEQSVQESPRTKAKYRSSFGRGNAESGITFLHVRDHADFLTALAFCPNHVIAISALADAEAKDIHVELTNGTKWKLSKCVFRSCIPEVATYDCTVTLTSYVILANGWSVV